MRRILIVFKPFLYVINGIFNLLNRKKYRELHDLKNELFKEIYQAQRRATVHYTILKAFDDNDKWYNGQLAILAQNEALLFFLNQIREEHIKELNIIDTNGMRIQNTTGKIQQIDEINKLLRVKYAESIANAVQSQGTKEE